MNYQQAVCVGKKNALLVFYGLLVCVSKKSNVLFVRRLSISLFSCSKFNILCIFPASNATNMKRFNALYLLVSTCIFKILHKFIY